MHAIPKFAVIAAAGAALVVACSSGTVKKATAAIAAKNASSTTGTATFTQSGDGPVELKLELSGAPAGMRAVHLHEKGDCSAADGSSAGTHWNPTAAAHGHLGESTPHHAGDIGNVEVAANGTASFTMSTAEWTIGTGDGGTTDIVGRAVIVHGGTDDYAAQPAGDAGSRIGCGVVTASGS